MLYSVAFVPPERGAFHASAGPAPGQLASDSLGPSPFPRSVFMADLINMSHWGFRSAWWNTGGQRNFSP